jgi:hypothetical protein
MQVKPKAKSKSKADQYDSKLLPKSGKQTPADFMPKSYDTRFKPVKGGGTGNEYLNLGPREKNPKGVSKNGSKLKKAKNGDTVDKGETKTGEVKVRPSFGQNFKSSMKNFMTTDSTDYQNTPAKTKAGKILRGANKVASVAARVAGSPAATAASALGSGVKSVQNAVAKRKELKAIPERKMGGKVAKMAKVAKKMAPKMIMKKTKKK